MKTNNVVEVNGRIIESEVEGSKNVIAFFDDGKRTIIWTKKGEPIRILSKDLDGFIIGQTWAYQNGYARTKVARSKLPELCERNGWDMEAFSGMDPKTQQVNIYIHRYVMGMFHKASRVVHKVQYKQVMNEHGISSINDMHVDHDINKSIDGNLKENNYSDKMRIVPPPVNTAYKVKPVQAYIQMRFPIVCNSVGYYQLVLYDGAGISRWTVKDNDAAGRNVAALQKELMELYPSMYVVPLGKYRSRIVEIKGNIEGFLMHREEFHNNLMDAVLLRAKEMQAEGKLILEAY